MTSGHLRFGVITTQIDKPALDHLSEVHSQTDNQHGSFPPSTYSRSRDDDRSGFTVR
jgi:hypothetical protein